MEISKFLIDYSKTILGKQQLIINAFAKALEVIPHQISDNAGLDSTKILNKLRQKHSQGLFFFFLSFIFSNTHFIILFFQKMALGLV